VKGTDKNPFLDKRVRLAFSKAINRDAIVERIMAVLRPWRRATCCRCRCLARRRT